MLVDKGMGQVQVWLWIVATAILGLGIRWLQPPGKETKKKSRSTLNTHPAAKLTFIVDGCNGPIRLEKTPKGTLEDSPDCVSLLRVVNGENRGDRIRLIPHLEELMATHPIENANAVVYFDGLGVRKQKAALADSWSPTKHVSFRITSVQEEADDAIVREIENRQDLYRVSKSKRKSDVFQQLLSSTSDAREAAVYTYKRHQSGPGRSRRLLNPLGLLRPESVYCILDGYWTTPTSSTQRDVKRVLAVERLLEDCVDEKPLGVANDGETVIVATDDVFLRQRIVQAGGIVLTFEQLWEILSQQD